VSNGLDDVAGPGLTLCPDHSSTLADAAEGLAQVAAAADEGDVEVVLLDVVGVIGGGQDLGLVDVVDANGLEDLQIRCEL
jgi:hypothetical protein